MFMLGRSLVCRDVNEESNNSQINKAYIRTLSNILEQEEEEEVNYYD